MASTSEKGPNMASAGSSPNEGLPLAAGMSSSPGAAGNGDDVVRDLEQLRDSFRKTPNALAPARSFPEGQECSGVGGSRSETSACDVERVHRTVAEPEARSAERAPARSD